MLCFVIVYECLNQLKEELRERSVWLAASTHPGEEGVVMEVHKELIRKTPRLLTIIVPRHPSRGFKIAKKFRALGLEVSLRSKKDPIKKNTDIYIADTIGELGLFYRLVDIVFIGKSLVNLGGQNVVEAAQLKNAILHVIRVYTHELSRTYF